MAFRILDPKVHFSVTDDIAYTAPSDLIHSEFKTSKLDQSGESVKILNAIQDLCFQNRIRTTANQRPQILIIVANLD